MPTFETWDVVKVPFPYTDRAVYQRRPALVIAAETLESAHALLWLLMITSAENRRWPEDVLISDIRKAGLPASSVVRCAKIATIDARDAERVGTLPAKERPRVSRKISAVLASALSADRRP